MNVSHITRAFALSASIGLALGACAGAPDPGVAQDPVVQRPAPDPTTAVPLAAAINDTGFALFAAATSASNDDVVLSPLSIGLAFGMLDAGATGSVADALVALYPFPGEGQERWHGFNSLTQGVEHEPEPAREDLSDEEWQPQEPIVRVANRMFYEESFVAEASYPETLATYWGAGAEALEMQAEPERARERINTWVAHRTNELIPELLPPGFVDDSSVMVLVNTVYMLADWAIPFEEKNTREEDFTLLDTSTVTVDMMRHPTMVAPVALGDKWAAVEIPYAESDLSMLVIVPDTGAYADVESRLDGEFLAQVDASLEERELSFAMPVFTSEATMNLRDVIENDLGIQGIFGVPDLLGIAPDVQADAAIHAAKIIVDERGTEAAGATAIGVELTSVPVEPTLSIRADKPFLYLVRDESTGAVLFMGRVLDPSAP